MFDLDYLIPTKKIGINLKNILLLEFQVSF